MDGLRGLVKSITTKSKVDTETGAIEHITSIKLQFSDLDRETLDVLAMAEAALTLLALELSPQKRG